MSLNKATIIGRVGKDPKIETTNGGTKVAKFSIATSERWTSKQTGEKQEKTEWHNIVIWNERLVGVVEKFVSKGSLLYIEGQIQTRKWQAQDGADRYTTEIVLQNFRGEIQLLSGKQDGGSSDDGGTKPSASKASANADLDDEIPF